MSSNKKKRRSAIMLLDCPDQMGIIHAICDFVLKNNGNIIELDQHVDRVDDHFFMRIVWDLDGFNIPDEKIGEYFDTLLGRKFQINWRLQFSDRIPRVAIFVSKYSHCLFDILSRYEAGEWKIEIPVIISNHEKFAHVAERHNIPFHHLPITKENKADQEQKTIEILKAAKVDFIILARYMQILSSRLVDAYPMQIINIHHSSLPAFAGANPYQAAYDRGVKFMGATAHYVTADLDEGPIIAQDVIPINHQHSPASMKRRGRDIEKLVLASAVWSHMNHKVLIYKNKTIVFE